MNISYYKALVEKVSNTDLLIGKSNGENYVDISPPSEDDIEKFAEFVYAFRDIGPELLELWDTAEHVLQMAGTSNLNGFGIDPHGANKLYHCVMNLDKKIEACAKAKA